MSERPIVIVGAGFAGLAAAVALHDLGFRVEIFEARDRLGGRTWTRPFGDHGPRVEYGGTWFMPEHRRVHRQLERAGSEIRDNRPTVWRWRTDDQIRHGLPVERSEWPQLEAALRRLVADAGSLAAGATEAGSLSFADYLKRLDTTRAVQDFLLGWQNGEATEPPCLRRFRRLSHAHGVQSLRPFTRVYGRVRAAVRSAARWL